MTRLRLQPLVVAAPLLVAGAALACPDCETARVVRASIWDEHVWSYLLMMVLPFLLIGTVSALLHRVGLPRRDMAPPPVPEEESDVGT